MKGGTVIGIMVAIALLTTVPHIYSQEIMRHTPNFPYSEGISIDDLMNNMGILSILNRLANRSIDYSEAIEALERIGALDRETAHRLAAIYNATDSEILNMIGNEQLSELIERFKEGNLSIDELKSIIQYIDHIYGLGVLDTIDYIALLNMISNLYSERGVDIPIDISSKVYRAFNKLLTTNNPLARETSQSVANISKAGVAIPSAFLNIPQVPLLPSTNIFISLNAMVVITIAILSIVLAIVFRDRIAILLNRLYRAISGSVYKASSRGLKGDKLDPIAVYWSAVRIMERLSKIKRNWYTTHREYLDMVNRIEDKMVYSMFVRLTQLYELYRFGFRKDRSIVDEAIKVYNSMVERYGGH